MIKNITQVLKINSLAKNYIKFFQSNTNNLFGIKSDQFNSVHVNINYVPKKQQEYTDVLKSHELDWKKNKTRAVWLKVQVNQVELLKETLNSGYQIHHATKDHIILQKWLLEEEKNKLPGYSSHYVGCGGAVINSKNEVLLISEKFGTNKNFWSFPGGRADPNEEIYETAEREVFEELGIKVKAVDLLLLRESTKSIFEKPDIYFAFLMRPIDENPVVKMCTDELVAYTWVPLSEIDQFIQKGKVTKYHLQKRILNKVNELYKAGFDFQKDQLTTRTFYENYPYSGINHIVTEMNYNKK